VWYQSGVIAMLLLDTERPRTLGWQGLAYCYAGFLVFCVCIALESIFAIPSLIMALAGLSAMFFALRMERNASLRSWAIVFVFLFVPLYLLFAVFTVERMFEKMAIADAASLTMATAILWAQFRFLWKMARKRPL